MGKVLPLRAQPEGVEDPEVAQAIRELERLLDSPPDLTRRGGQVMLGTAVPARELLRPILRKLHRPLTALVAVGSTAALLMVGFTDAPMEHDHSTVPSAAAPTPVVIDNHQKAAGVTKPASPPTPQADTPTVPPASAAPAASQPPPTPAPTPVAAGQTPVTNTLPGAVPAAAVPATPTPVPVATAVPQVPPTEPVEDVVKGAVRDASVVP